MDRPIIFSAPMVRVLLDGRKTQTRRAVRTQPTVIDGVFMHHVAGPKWESGLPYRCPYGKPGDRLWVKETWHHAVPIGVPTTTSDYKSSLYVDYRADVAEQMQSLWKWKSPMFMPRWASRITLEITDVRVQRLQDISEEDAIAEGIKFLNGRYTFNEGLHESRTAKESYMALWESINGVGSWDVNSWVWALSFRIT
jgi:hypothetical protein